MSGGSYNYFYQQLESYAEDIRNLDINPKRKLFSQLLVLCAKAAKDIEWVDSGDYGPGDEDKAIDEVFLSLNVNPEVQLKAAAFDAVIKIMRNVK
jgi:hypothetical protein